MTCHVTSSTLEKRFKRYSSELILKIKTSLRVIQIRIIIPVINLLDMLFISSYQNKLNEL